MVSRNGKGRIEKNSPLHLNLFKDFILKPTVMSSPGTTTILIVSVSNPQSSIHS